MAAADVTARAELPLAEENVLLTVSTGETYTTRLANVKDVQCTSGESGWGTAVAAGVSGRVITFTSAGMTDKLVYVTIKGDL